MIYNDIKHYFETRHYFITETSKEIIAETHSRKGAAIKITIDKNSSNPNLCICKIDCSMGLYIQASTEWFNFEETYHLNMFLEKFEENRKKLEDNIAKKILAYQNIKNLISEIKI